ncbi:MAG: hypothetical protein AMXMBFR7_28310 [Planctomycetota bacterium]
MPLPDRLLQTGFLCAALSGLLAVSALRAEHVWIEGEAAHESNFVKHNWYDAVTKTVLSGGEWASHYGPDAGEITYSFKIEAAGDFRFWVRCNNLMVTMQWQLNGEEWEPCDFAKKTEEQIISDKPDHRNLAWHDFGTLKLKPGAHTLKFKLTSKISNHGGIDCLALTSGDYTPTGTKRPDGSGQAAGAGAAAPAAPPATPAKPGEAKPAAAPAKPAAPDPAQSAPKRELAGSGMHFSPEVAAGIRAQLKKGLKGASKDKILWAGSGTAKSPAPPAGWAQAAALPALQTGDVTPLDLLRLLPDHLLKEKPAFVFLHQGALKSVPDHLKADWDDVCALCGYFGAVPILVVPEGGPDDPLRGAIVGVMHEAKVPAMDGSAADFPQRVEAILRLTAKHILGLDVGSGSAAPGKPGAPAVEEEEE